MATYLTPDRRLQVQIGSETITINQKIVPDSFRASKDVCSYVRKGQPIKPCAKIGGDGRPRGICIHNTGDIKVNPATNPAEQYCRASYNGNLNGVIVHYYVWHNEIWQLLSDTEQGWHAADGRTRRGSHRSGETIGGNLDTIAIECIGPDMASEVTTAKLTAYLLRAYNLSPDTDVYTHQYFYAPKRCPLYILPHWDDFLELVCTFYHGKADGLVRVFCGKPKTQNEALALVEKLRQSGYNSMVVKTDGGYAVQCGAFRQKQNAAALRMKLLGAGFDGYIK